MTPHILLTQATLCSLTNNNSKMNNNNKVWHINELQTVMNMNIFGSYLSCEKKQLLALVEK